MVKKSVNRIGAQKRLVQPVEIMAAVCGVNRIDNTKIKNVKKYLMIIIPKIKKL